MRSVVLPLIAIAAFFVWDAYGNNGRYAAQLEAFLNDTATAFVAAISGDPILGGKP
jgi:hypothetical protein